LDDQHGSADRGTDNEYGSHIKPPEQGDKGRSFIMGYSPRKVNKPATMGVAKNLGNALKFSFNPEPTATVWRWSSLFQLSPSPLAPG
ncbi:MAG: hypothetical protein KKA28_06380, partial [Planctomycetes bacterium]|nr:hypothetical protein [Planctomycetota bacterium]